MDLDEEKNIHYENGNLLTQCSEIASET